MHKLVLIRHGESTWNQENRFTGWTDVDLTDRGREEAGRAGRLLKEQGYTFDIAYVSVLKRAIRTLWIVLTRWTMSGSLSDTPGVSTSAITAPSRASTSRRPPRSSAR